jgi:hypothetical protein
MVQAPRGHAPDGELGQGRNPDVRVQRIGGLEHHSGGRDPEAFDGELAVQDRHHARLTISSSPSLMPACSMESPDTRTM